MNLEQHLDQVLEAYSEYGIILHRKPRLIKTIEPDYIMFVVIDPNSYHDNLRLDFERMAEELELDPENKSTLIKTQLNKDSTLFKKYKKNTGDIFVNFETLRYLCSQNSSPNSLERFHLAHEVWHLHELQEGIFSNHPSIAEGTATYSSFRLINVRDENGSSIRGGSIEEFMKLPLDSLGPFMRYTIFSSIVASVVESSENPFKELLKPEIREEIFKRIIDLQKRYITSKPSNTPSHVQE